MSVVYEKGRVRFGGVWWSEKLEPPDPDATRQEIDYCWTHGNNHEGTTGGIYPKDECPGCATIEKGQEP